MTFFAKRSVPLRLSRHLIGRTMLVLTLIAAAGGLAAGAAETGSVIPAPAVDLPQAADGKLQTAVLAGGCFWGVQAVFQHVKGVESAVSGYSGGNQATAHYEIVGSGRTGHAESVQITFDPRSRQLRPDSADLLLGGARSDAARSPGPGCRDAIPIGDLLKRRAQQAARAQATSPSSIRPTCSRATIATRLEPFQAFFPAEGYHQDYLTLHPNNPYIVYNDLPKLDELKRLFPNEYRAEPKLVAAARPPS